MTAGYSYSPRITGVELPQDGRPIVIRNYRIIVKEDNDYEIRLSSVNDFVQVDWPKKSGRITGKTARLLGVPNHTIVITDSNIISDQGLRVLNCSCDHARGTRQSVSSARIREPHEDPEVAEKLLRAGWQPPTYFDFVIDSTRNNRQSLGPLLHTHPLLGHREMGAYYVRNREVREKLLRTLSDEDKIFLYRSRYQDYVKIPGVKHRIYLYSPSVIPRKISPLSVSWFWIRDELFGNYRPVSQVNERYENARWVNENYENALKKFDLYNPENKDCVVLSLRDISTVMKRIADEAFPTTDNDMKFVRREAIRFGVPVENFVNSYRILHNILLGDFYLRQGVFTARELLAWPTRRELLDIDEIAEMYFS